MGNTRIFYWVCEGVLGLVSFVFLKFYKNARVKRIAYPFVLAIGTLVFLYIVWSTFGRPDAFLYVFTGVAVLIAILNWRATVFCDSCGATSYSRKPLFRPTECSECGSKWV